MQKDIILKITAGDYSTDTHRDKGGEHYEAKTIVEWDTCGTESCPTVTGPLNARARPENSQNKSESQPTETGGCAGTMGYLHRDVRPPTSLFASDLENAESVSYPTVVGHLEPEAEAEGTVFETISPGARNRQTLQVAFNETKAPITLQMEHFTVLTRADGNPWELGQGAMGITYKALDNRLHCHVALKSINAELLARNSGASERFLREARAAARLRHPNIASVFHLGETADGQAFYTMEFIEGDTLDARVRRRGPLPVGLVLEVGIEAARALVAAAQKGLIHRDLKPANLMLVAGVDEAAAELQSCPNGVNQYDSRAETGEVLVKVIDFGLAKVAAESGPTDRPNAFVGTPQFASPEQIWGNDEATDARSDIYSLGATLWFALTGRLPFPGRTLTEVRNRQMTATLPIEQLAAAQVPTPVAELLASMLAIDPAERPQTPHALLTALRRCRLQLCASEPTTASLTPPEAAKSEVSNEAVEGSASIGKNWIRAATQMAGNAGRKLSGLFHRRDGAK